MEVLQKGFTPLHQSIMLHGCCTSYREGVNWNNRIKERTAVKLINRGANIHARTMVSYYTSLHLSYGGVICFDVIGGLDATSFRCTQIEHYIGNASYRARRRCQRR